MKITREILVKHTTEEIFTITKRALFILDESNSKIIKFAEIPELQKKLPQTINVGEKILVEGLIIDFDEDEYETSKKKRRKKDKPAKQSVFTVLKYSVNKEIACRIQQQPFIDATISLKFKSLGSLTKLELLAHIRLPWFLKPFGFIITKVINKFDDREWLTEIKDALESPEIYELLQNNPLWIYDLPQDDDGN